MIALTLCIICLFIMAFAAYVVAQSKGRRPWDAAIGTLMVAPLFFVVLFHKADFLTGDEDNEFVRFMKIAGSASFVAMIAIFLFDIAIAYTSIPTCDSTYARENAMDAFKQSSAAQNFGIHVIGFMNTSEIHSSDRIRSCVATAVLNNGAHVPAQYSMTFVDSQLYVSIQLSP